MRPLASRCHLGLGKLNRRPGNREEVREHLTTASTMYPERDMTYWLEKGEGGDEGLGVTNGEETLCLSC